MDMADRGRAIASECHVHHAVVQRAGEAFVEADHHVNRLRTGCCGLIGGTQIAGQISGIVRHLAHTAFDEIARERRFRELHDLRPRIERGGLGQHLADATEISMKVPFAGAKLGEGEMKLRHAVRKGRTGGAMWATPLDKHAVTSERRWGTIGVS